MEVIDGELSGGTAGATVQVSPGASFALFGGDLDHLTFEGTDLTEGDSYNLYITGGLNLSGHTLNVTGSYQSVVFFTGAGQTIDDLSIDGTAPANTMYGPAQLTIDSSLSLGATATIHGSASLGEGAFGSTFINNGTIDADMAGQPLNVYYVTYSTNNGTIMASGGGYLNLADGGLVNNGTIKVSGSGSRATVGQFTGSGTMTVGDGMSANTLTLTTNGGVSSLSTLIINSGSKLDLTNNLLLIKYNPGADPVAAVRGYLASGYNGGAWNGPGIDSSTAASDTAYAVGYADAADNVIYGLSANEIVVAYTLYGDTNIDGVVNSVDFGNLAGNFGKSGKVWDQGDFDYNGAVNSIDFGLLAGNFGKSVGSNADVANAADWAALDAFAAAHGLMAEMPEPGQMAILALGSIGFFSRRRRPG
ncbi:MAG TPA: PEP-CTERM sorting domain-containing protein [Tepidisphaeraceae bacterium]|nr:PEP-CTERM sorting domain-containing protein [Tepidisphaeraceae bacterium]